ncbi:acyl-CoA synthetase (AMP-forming)/AMP-acid ligase II [Sphingobium sp. OAS761]|uniref:FadD3 family acyl-CoA ligase n=1 Tax=Sphingobium sp. OAS761 TaxID=2817901 RepID=UPI00209DF4F1|nr:FadD3 family acyl-CoA ligase [Sphingobium sp. OAS761]MCP1471717.1 acyl-CoA synthetase (AMP-forming)/AMP-acid ligase II [Sphingobium sp. OAS761]
MTDQMGTWPETIPASAKAAAEKWPYAVGLIEGDRHWTFAKIWADARLSASALLGMGIGHGDRVAIWAPNCRAWVIAALGAHIVGAAIVPLNTRFKGQEAADIIRRSHAKLVFAPQNFLDTDYKTLLSAEDLPDMQEVIYTDTGFAAFLARGKGPDDPAVDAAFDRLSGDDISDIIFTSGTTGRPKGAIATHRQVVQTFGDWAVRVDLREGDKYLIVNPFFHTFGYKAGWVNCLTRGATIVPMAMFDGAEMVRQIEQNRISFLPGPPTIYLTLLQELAGDKPRDFSSLRVAVTGAAPVAPSLVDRMRTELGMSNIVNGYGMTECGVISMTCQGDDAETVAHTCGYPMPGMEIRCVDDDGKDVPIGEAGEFWVRGHSVMKGYLDDATATAEAIDPDGWLHTGDIGTIDARGYLKITDRKKDMYISGGFNCYPAEIEKLLAAHPAIETAAVIGIPDERMGEIGKAFVVLRPGAEADERGIIGWAREHMANYKTPRKVAFVDALPRNAGGKVLRTALREIDKE